jgi:hypothetical protein
LATLNGCLFMAWTEPNGKVDVICSTDGVHFANKVRLAARTADSPAVAAFNGRLYVGFTGTNGKLKVESSANGMTFGSHVTLAASSFYSPALAAFNGRLYIACTATNEHLCLESSANGTAFGNEMMLDDYTSAAAPALSIENPGPKGQPARLIAGVTNVEDTGIWLLDMTKRLANPKAPVPPTHSTTVRGRLRSTACPSSLHLPGRSIWPGPAASTFPISSTSCQCRSGLSDERRPALAVARGRSSSRGLGSPVLRPRAQRGARSTPDADFAFRLGWRRRHAACFGARQSWNRPTWVGASEKS